MNRKEWLLLVIAAADGQELTPAQLQKSVFLLAEERREAVDEGFYNFEPYHYGPFCLDVYHDAEDLEIQGLIAIHINRTGRWQEYRATAEGIRQAAALEKSVEADVVRFIKDKVAWTRGLNFQELIRNIYRQYPHFRANSVFSG
ncbi:MAG: hypothetical protein OXF63_03155 [Anaerolineaceae bacterium]|nr:hypothetical protein [Anaerolineaceae bacterium]